MAVTLKMFAKWKNQDMVCVRIPMNPAGD